MEIYSLTEKGRALAHSVRGNSSNPNWGVIYFLSKQGRATKEQIHSYVSNSTSATLSSLRMKGIIRDETEVSI